MKNFYTCGRAMAMAALVVFAAVSCDTNNSDPELDLMPVNSVDVNGSYTVSLFAESELETGANNLYWKIEKGGSTAALESFSIMPMMDMHTMEHSTPFDQPALFAENEDYYYNRTVFIMPGGEMGSWYINFEFITMDGEEVSGMIPIEVNSSWKLTSVKDTNDQVYFITWLAPQKPVSGNNELKFLLHKRNGMMSFPAVSDAELVVYPYMDMGSGQGHSTDFTPPAPMGDGMYAGDINYSMSGTWTTSVQVVADNDTLPEVVFEYSVQAK